MLRQRLRDRSSPVALLGRAIVALLAAALVFYGAMLMLLAFKVDPGTVDGISAYRSIFDELAGLRPSDATGTVRLVAGLAGLAVFLACGYLAYKELPRPYLARSPLVLSEEERGQLLVQPRAVERMGEIAARRHPAVTSARGRVDADAIVMEVTLRRAAELHDVLHSVQLSVREALTTHGFPARPVAVTLAGFDRRNRRELR